MKLTRTRRTWAVAAAVATIVTAANVSQGGYFSQSWGWIALAFLVPTTILLILDRVETPGRMRAAFAALVVAYSLWLALSATWSISSAATIREIERVLVYVALALAVALVLRRGDAPGVLGGAALGVTLICTYALCTRLIPDHFHTDAQPIESNRLAAPLGYWNSLGLLAAMGVLLTFGFVAHARRDLLALAGGVTLPVGLVTLYLTFSRGAWLALAIGFAAAVILDPRRIRLLWTTLVVAIPAGLCVAYASSLDALTREGATASSLEREGHRLAIVLGIAAAASAVAASGARWASRQVPVSERGRRRFALGLALVALTGVVGALALAGGPRAAYEHARDRFNSDPTSSGVDLNGRLFSISGNGRSEQLRVAWDAARERPIVGNGSGTFEYLWYQHRRTSLVVRDAHSLYMETFTELGVVGLVLLLGTLAALAIGAMAARRARFVPAAFGAFIAWTAASAVDWHWEMVGVTMTALLAGAAGLVTAERGQRRLMDSRVRTTLTLAAGVLSIAAVWSLVGNQALFGGREAVARRDWSEARDDARRAKALLFWSAEPNLVLGDAEAGLGDREAALAAYRGAVATDPRSWVAWLRVAQVAQGAERADAYRRVRTLNPREEGLPGD
jgi:O-antigen ligase